MAVLEWLIDLSIFPIEVVTRTAHRYTDRYFVALTSSDSGLRISLAPKAAHSVEPALRQQFENDLLDDQLRERVGRETATLHTLLVSAALREAAPGNQSVT